MGLKIVRAEAHREGLLRHAQELLQGDSGSGGVLVLKLIWNQGYGLAKARWMLFVRDPSAFAVVLR